MTTVRFVRNGTTDAKPTGQFVKFVKNDGPSLKKNMRWRIADLPTKVNQMAQKMKSGITNKFT